jgi:BirA family transcriptional regulator, biotin operon repressor / biotin---[acetyl-CoA-carboxylase] ligase
MHVALGRSDRHARDARDLLVREAEGIPEDDRYALLRRQAGERLGYLSPHIREEGRARGICLLSRRLVLELERLRLAHALACDAVPAGVDHEPMKPRGELRLAAELAQARAELDERLLGRVPCLLEIAHELRGDPLDARGVALDERVERASVAVSRLRDQIHVAQLPVRLREQGQRLLVGLTHGRGDGLHGGGSLAAPVPDTLAPEAVEPLLGGRFGRPYLYQERCESTQRLLEPGIPEGAVAVCDVQTGGRGRLGRGWEAPAETAVLCSTLLRPPAGRKIAELSLVGGLAAAEAVERATGLAAQIKWPNDVMLNRRKVAGVLAEAIEDAVVLGIGLNVNQTRDDLPAEAATAPGSLRTADGVVRERAPVLADLLATLERHYDAWREDGLGALYEGLGSRDFLRGRKIRVDGSEGFGVAIDRNGRLEVEIGGERRLLESGEVLFAR